MNEQNKPPPQCLPLIMRIEALRDSIKVMMEELKELNCVEADTAYVVGELALKEDEKKGSLNESS